MSGVHIEVSPNGNATWTVDHKDGDPLPDDSCARLDPAVTK